MPELELLQITQVLASEGKKILQRQKDAAQVSNSLKQLFCEEKNLQKYITFTSSVGDKWRWKTWLRKHSELLHFFSTAYQTDDRNMTLLRETQSYIATAQQFSLWSYFITVL